MTPYAPDAWAYGGIPRVVDALVGALAARGHRVTVCTTDVRDAGSRLGSRPCRPASAPAAADATVEWRVVRNLSNRLAYLRQLFTPLGLGAVLRANVHRFDVAHLHACRNLPGVVAAHHLHAAGVPYVLAPNGTAPRLERGSVAPAPLCDVTSAKRPFPRLRKTTRGPLCGYCGSTFSTSG